MSLEETLHLLLFISQLVAIGEKSFNIKATLMENRNVLYDLASVPIALFFTT